MRMPDMRLIVFVTLILLTAAMPANCAEEPTVWSGLVTEGGNPTQARSEWTTDPAGTLRRTVRRCTTRSNAKASLDVDGEYRHLCRAMPAVREAIQRRAAGRTFAHTLRDVNNEAQTFAAVDQVLDDARLALAAAAR